MTLPHTLIRSKRKTISLQVTSAAELVVRAPERVSLETIHALIHARTPWIEKHQERIRSTARAYPSYTFISGETFYLEGEVYQVVLSPHVGNTVMVLGNELFVKPGAPSVVRKRIVTWYRGEAALRIGERVEWYQKLMGVSWKRITYTSARKRWGSCSKRGELTFSWRLVIAPRFVIDYVVVHELAHMKEHNHGPRFWKVVHAYYPDYARAKEWLKENYCIMNV